MRYTLRASVYWLEEMSMSNKLFKSSCVASPGCRSIAAFSVLKAFSCSLFL